MGIIFVCFTALSFIDVNMEPGIATVGTYEHVGVYEDVVGVE